MPDLSIDKTINTPSFIEQAFKEFWNSAENINGLSQDQVNLIKQAVEGSSELTPELFIEIIARVTG